MLVSEAIDRSFSEWLEKAGKGRSAYEILTTTPMTDTAPASGATFTVFGRTGAPTTAASRRIEIDSEIIDVRSMAGTTWTVEERGVQETVAASHSVGARIFLAPDFYRVHVLNALKSIIGQLYAWGVYRRVVETTETYSETSPTVLATAAKEVVSIRVKNSDGSWGRKLIPGRQYDALLDMSPISVQFYNGGYQGAVLQVIYKADYDTSTFTEATNLDTVGVPSTLQPYLPMAAAAYLFQGREYGALNNEDVKQAIAQATSQMTGGTIVRTAAGLMNLFKAEYVASERNRLLALDGTRMVFS
jgi:hypothetical protein